LLKDGNRARDLLDRDFTGEAPNRTWVLDFTTSAPGRGWSTSRIHLGVFAQKTIA
jgi:putative transposase